MISYMEQCVFLPTSVLSNQHNFFISYYFLINTTYLQLIFTLARAGTSTTFLNIQTTVTNTSLANTTAVTVWNGIFIPI